MKNTIIIKFKITFLTIFGLTVSNAQILTNNGQSPLISNSNVLFDGSTNFSTEAGAGAYVGKGIIIPSVDLVNFAFDLNLADGSTFPTFFDGMIVYNNATGSTLTTGNRSSLSTSVAPGFYYFSNPNGVTNSSVTDGVWKPLGGVTLTGTAPIAVTSGIVTLNDSGITSIKIANDAVTSAKILDGAIATVDVDNNAITGVKLENNISLPGTASMTLPSGTTTQRPSTLTAGMLRYNTTDSIMEYYNGNAWVRPTPGSIYTGSTSTVLNGSSFERAALTGDVTAAANSNATTIANNVVTSAKILDGTITSTDLSATAGITNGQLANNSVTINGTNFALGGSGAISYNTMRGVVTTVTATSYTLAANDYAIITNNATGVTITMPDLTPADAGRTVFIFNNNTVPIANSFGGTIPVGVTTLNQYRAMELMWTGTIWVIMGK